MGTARMMRQQLLGIESSGVEFVRLLRSWFVTAARDLPWRRTRDPYGIWVAEVMLQQTRVQTVVSYWERWMQHLPTLEHLASATPERVLKLWEGLGYYSRAKNLKRAARVICERWGGGGFPEDLEDVRDLPGVGRYTAGAIGSIAFGKPTPIVDGNVARVLARFFGIQEDIRTRSTIELLWAAAQILVEEALRQGCERPVVHPPRRTVTGDFNEALMELGAMVCTATNPICGVCPVQHGCFAFANDSTRVLPKVSPRPKTKPLRNVTLLLEFGDRILLHQRPDEGVNATFWEFPQVPAPGRTPLTARRVHRLFHLDGYYDLARVASIRHSITRHRILLEVFKGAGRGDEVFGNVPGRWVNERELETIPLTSAHRRIAKRLRFEPGEGIAMELPP